MLGDFLPVSRAGAVPTAGGRLAGGVRRGEKGGSPETYFRSQGFISLFLVLKDQRGNIAFRSRWSCLVSEVPSSSLVLPQLDRSFYGYQKPTAGPFLGLTLVSAPPEAEAEGFIP